MDLSDNRIFHSYSYTHLFGKAWLFLFCFVFWCTFSLRIQASPRLFSDDDNELVIVIDPGHGGENLGTTENRFMEKDMTLITAKAMMEELQKYENVTVYLTREEDKELSLKERAEFAENVDADFLFSIHYNASSNHNFFGAEVWIPAHSPYHAMTYQFAYTELAQLRDMGLFIRGIKTHVEQDVEYYGIIRENLKLSIPALIIEHCHVDNRNDTVFCDTEQKLIDFGKADATAAAKYFGLKSTTLGVDYGEYDLYPAVASDSVVNMTLNAGSPPDVCVIDTESIDEENGQIVIQLTASDEEIPVIYYEYSIDGGKTYYPITPWPDVDVLAGSYNETIHVPIQIPAGIKARIKFRVYNMYDQPKESNVIALANALYYEEQSLEETVSAEPEADEVIGGDFVEKGEKITFDFHLISDLWLKHKDEYLYYIEIVLVMALFLTSLLLSILFIKYAAKKNRKRRRRRR